MVEVTTIKISKDVKDKMDKIKIHPRETYEDVVVRLMKNEKQ